MRILRLDLEKYGAFEGRTLTFRPDARLHVVYGPNEAGKSSALSAVGDLLFGFGVRTDFAFRHATGDLRLGATIVATGGQELVFRRRKGKTGTLIGADDKPLRDDLLVPFLGQLTRETFERAFGLGAASLRKAAEDLLAKGGDSGASLFAAASGLRGIETLRRTLDGEAEALFSPLARTKPFNDVARRHEAAHKAVRDNELGATRWKRLNDEIEALEERHRGLETERSKARTERARVERLARAHGAALELAQARRALSEFGDAPELGSELIREIAERLGRAEEAEKSLALAGEALRVAAEELSQIEIDPAALSAAADIGAVVRESGAFGKNQEDLPRVRREAEEVDEDLDRLARRLGLAEGSSVEAAMPTDAVRDDLSESLRQGREIAHAREAAGRAVAGERLALDTLAGQRGAEQVADPKPLREAFSAIAPQLRSLDRRAELAEDHAREIDALAEAGGRMSPPIADLDRLASRPTPSAEWIARMRRDHERIGLDRDRADELSRAQAAEAQKIEAEIGRMGSTGPIASPETIRGAREAREVAWRPLRATLRGEAREEAQGLDEVGAYERAVAEADRLADRLAEDARRAARHSELERRGDELQREREAATTERAAVDARAAAFDEAWSLAWVAFGVAPGAPDEMESWRKEYLALVERRESGGRRAAALSRLDAAEAALRPELLKIAAACGVDGSDSVDAVALGARVEARLDRLADRWREQSTLAAQIADAERRLADAERDVRGIADRDEAWRVRWSSMLPGLGFGPHASFQAVDAALLAWREAPGLTGQRATLSRRVRGMERDANSFRERVGGLVAAFAPELADLPPQAAAERLGRRLMDARSAEARRDDASRRRDDAAKSLSLAGRAAADADAALQTVTAGLGSAAEARILLPRIEHRSRLRRNVVERREQALKLGGSLDEAALVSELADFEPDAAPAAIERLEAEERRIDRDAQQAWAELHAARASREALGGAEAERAAAEGRAAGAALYEMAREWAVTKLASLLLGAAIERARAMDRSPTLERAARLFETLTGGGFSGFAEDYDDDALVLFGRRASGETTPISGMSEGTRDQFYLALRLAALEDYAARAEPAPFIGDDLFASFDDDRTAHGLMALAEVGARVQPVLFTHHRAVVETARKTLGEAVDVIQIERN